MRFQETDGLMNKGKYIYLTQELEILSCVPYLKQSTTKSIVSKVLEICETLLR